MGVRVLGSYRTTNGLNYKLTLTNDLFCWAYRLLSKLKQN